MTCMACNSLDGLEFKNKKYTKYEKKRHLSGYQNQMQIKTSYFTYVMTCHVTIHLVIDANLLKILN